MNDKLIKKADVLAEYIKIGETKLDAIIKEGNFVMPIFIDGFAHGLYSVREIEQWIEEQKQKRNITK
ncbi:hypothetical protein N5U00_10615 [Aliarcobacter butzleri]|uniref:helix-turn-helix transcriptional regulator n=1 Tax=Aliarcobacter butzleri TaxID=28197 RepID=UPI0021B2C55D|nr:hypothetical protein [Aliarcobacter butzleri]MCT7570405.1 hypothetical protein [Aliarcobacter butzleri]MCT7572853.1 hypothetical protein [Aliarcobacter butzleri]MCT7575782.1 hypothetical protein [Aliarcobacter butzleri]MCT7579846.1 hypothetical protein [Aliarcobacter butzleri]